MSTHSVRRPINMEMIPDQPTPRRQWPDGSVERSETLRALDAALEDLTEERRRAFVFAEIEGLPHAEIALVENVAIGTIKSRISRAKEHLRSRLHEISTHLSP